MRLRRFGRVSGGENQRFHEADRALHEAAEREEVRAENTQLTDSTHDCRPFFLVLACAA